LPGARNRAEVVAMLIDQRVSITRSAPQAPSGIVSPALQICWKKAPLPRVMTMRPLRQRVSQLKKQQTLIRRRSAFMSRVAGDTVLKKRSRVPFVGSALVGLLVALSVSAPASTSTQGVHERATGALPPVAKNAKLDSTLAQLDRLGETRGAATAARAARPAGISTAGASARIEVEARRARELRALVERHGGRVELRFGRRARALVPVTRLAALAAEREIVAVSQLATPFPDAVGGEGPAATGATAWQGAGLTGAGVRVAVVDLGFGGYRARQAGGDLPQSLTTVDFCPAGTFETTTSHGTAVAEIVSEMAPGAQLYLICVADAIGLAKAEQYARAQGILIISHSVSWYNTSRGDGLGAAGTPDAIVADARAANILWVNSAGNYAQRHWSGTFVDTDSDGWHNFTPADEGNTVTVAAGARICGYLKWDEWPTGTTDFDLYLALSGQVVASSQNRQPPNRPIESLCYTNSTGLSQNFYFEIRRFGGTGTPRFDLLAPRNKLQYQTPEGSVTEPGSSPNAFTAAAICWQNNALEAYSSRGPTIDGRVKPDIAGQDSVSSATFGLFSNCGGSGFTGTSAAAPHVAGAAVLVKQANPGFGAAQLQTYLESHALDLGSPGKDSAYGAGKLTLSPLSSTTVPRCLVPHLVGRKLRAAKRAIRRADCRVGSVRRVHSRARRGRVIAQRPRAGSSLPRYARVHLKVSRGRR
jgi:subtilisin family serine protease